MLYMTVKLAVSIKKTNLSKTLQGSKEEERSVDECACPSLKLQPVHYTYGILVKIP